MPDSHQPSASVSGALARRTGRQLRRSMVEWFRPGLLLRTLFTVAAARLFGRYADRRDAMQSRPADGPFRYDDHNELWLDYVADLGDGWDSTTTVASVLAAPELVVNEKTLPHGRVLVMGGDAVYPAATREEYLRRLEAPYYSVLPYSPENAPRDLFVLPGNHDWYDGLAAFSALFMQQRWFAGWRTRQSRSYFVLRLPQRWWLIAADIQLDNDIDTVQRDYLTEATREISPGDRVVLACAEPYWLAAPESIARRNMAWLERRLVSERGAKVRVSLSGDLHHYQRHEDGEGAQRIVSGGGGAFLHGTAWQPPVLREPLTSVDARVSASVDEKSTANTVKGERIWQQRALYPSPRISRLLALRALFFPFMNPGFSLLLGGLLTFLLWGLDAASNGLLFGNIALGSRVGPYVLLETLPASPWLTLAIVGWCSAFVAFVDPPRSWPLLLASLARTWLGVTHALLHVWMAVAVLALVLPSRIDELPVFFGTLAALWLAVSLLSGLLFGAYLFVTYQLFGLHQESLFAALRVADFKHVLRIHIAADGLLTVHVLAISRVCRRWRQRTPVAQGEAFVEPDDGVTPSRRVRCVDTVVVRPE